MYEHHISCPVPQPYTAPSRYSQLPDKVRAIVDMVSAECGVSAEDILGDSRKRPIAYARFKAAARLRAMPWVSGAHSPGRPSLPQIARWLGGGDHTSVMHMLRRAKELGL